MWQPTPMRRRDRALPEAEAVRILQQGQYGVLATAGADGDPLGTPLSYVLLDGALYFHCAKKGQKLANIEARPRVCFTVVGATRPEYVADRSDFTTRFESAMAHGRATLVQNEDEANRALLALCKRYLPDFIENAEGSIRRSLAATAVVRIDIDSLTAKGNWPAEHAKEHP